MSSLLSAGLCQRKLINQCWILIKYQYLCKLCVATQLYSIKFTFTTYTSPATFNSIRHSLFLFALELFLLWITLTFETISYKKVFFFLTSFAQYIDLRIENLSYYYYYRLIKNKKKTIIQRKELNFFGCLRRVVMT